MKNLVIAAFMTVASLATTGSAQAIDLRSNLGGTSGYGELTQQANDDGSSNRLNLPFAVNFFNGNNVFNTFFVNNNGNITFSSALPSYTPVQFPSATQPVIAPFWADVDTRGTGAVYAAAPNADTVVVTWKDVGYFSNGSNKTNDFQLTLLNRADTGAGNFDIEFRYNRLEWTTGEASGGSNGLGGIRAQAGYDAGNGTNFFVLPGSFTDGVLDLANTSNVSQETPGLWTMAIRNGATSDGATADAPLLPEIVTAAGFLFNFDIDLDQRIFIDPEVAIGYDYVVSAGPNIRTVLLPSLPGETDGYTLLDLDGNLLGTVLAGEIFDFGILGVNGFSVRDIDANPALDPNDTQAFVTGLTFVGAGSVSMRQTPVTASNGPATDVPEPSTLLLLGAGLIAARRLGGRRKTAPAN
jgi:hypothetical protein